MGSIKHCFSYTSINIRQICSLVSRDNQALERAKKNLDKKMAIQNLETHGTGGTLDEVEQAEVKPSPTAQEPWDFLHHEPP